MRIVAGIIFEIMSGVAQSWLLYALVQGRWCPLEDTGMGLTLRFGFKHKCW